MSAATIMDDLGQLEAYSRQLSAAIHALGGCHRRLASSEQTGEESKSQDEDVDSAKAKILAIAASIRRTVSGPTDLLQHFVCQVCAHPPVIPHSVSLVQKRNHGKSTLTMFSRTG